MKRILIALTVVMGLALTGCASYDPDVDKTALEQDSYMMFKTDKKLVECHAPGTSGYGGMGNEIFEYPAGQRTWSFTESSSSEMKPVQVVTSDGQTLHIPGFIKFTLTGDCDKLYDFHKKVGVKYNAYESGGWNNLGNDYLGVAITSALNDVAGEDGWLELYTDASVRAQVEAKLEETLGARIADSLGGDWITVNGVSLSKPLASEELVNGLEAAEKAKLENAAQLQRNATARTKYQSISDCTRHTSQDWCSIFFLAENDDLQFLPIPNGGDVNYSSR